MITMDPRVHIRSTWKDAVGKRLTSRKIHQYQLAGWYGPAARARALAADAHKDKHPDGIVHRCACGSDGARYYKYSYLPKAGYYCPRCLAVHRATIEREKELARAWHNRIVSEYQ